MPVSGPANHEGLKHRTFHLSTNFRAMNFWHFINATAYHYLANLNHHLLQKAQWCIVSITELHS